MKEDRFAMVDSFIRSQEGKPGGFSASACLRMFGVSRSGYYAWSGRQRAEKEGKPGKKELYDRDIMDKMHQVVVARSGVIPGKRTFRAELFRRFGITVNVKRIARLMKRMKLVAQIPHKDAYKHQASHNHICAAPPNEVCQDFFQGPRKVILTDITYLYYGSARTPFYLCVFRDAYVRENLGWYAADCMDTDLVKNAYNRMMEDHKGEFRDAAVYIHSDQGSQYLSTSFHQLLSDNGFIQSVSARGNSQDNSPMESFFSRLKTDVLDLVALCRTLDSAVRLVDGYLQAYNKEHYQYELAALTPEEFYRYATTGVYPLESYFGVPASEMMAVDDLKKVRRIYADEEARKRREAFAAKREDRRMIDPLRIIQRDLLKLNTLIRQWKDTSETAEKQVEHLTGILARAEEALKYLISLPWEKQEELKDPLKWRLHKELDYVFAMNELF
ncbi:MAG: IS3 family transposase [Eubacteriales bacterium]|nr:IS3 family transposase [Eubacteriales bacterium]